MGLRISTNVTSQNVQNNLRKASEQSEVNLARLSSGKRINNAADDAAGLAMAKKMEAQGASLQQATRNAADGISFVQTAEGALNEVSNILVRLRELSIQSSSDTIADVEREYANMEYQQLIEEVDRISNTTSFNGVELLNGSQKDMEFQVGSGSSGENRINFSPSEIDSQARSLGIHNIKVDSKRDAQDSIDKVDDAIDKVNSHRASLGAVQSRLNSTISNLESQSLNQDAARSRIEDADIAKEAASLATNNILKQAGMATLAQANSLPANALTLI